MIKSVALQNEYIYYNYPKQDERSSVHYDNVLLPMWKDIADDFLKLNDEMMDNDMLFSFQLRNFFLRK